MDTIKKYLEGIGSDENQIKDFLDANEQKIKDFFKSTWEEQFVQTSDAVKEEVAVEMQPVQLSETEELQQTVQTENNQEQTDMAKFDSGEKFDKEKAQSDTLAFQIKNKQITFTNGKVGKQYDVDFDFGKLDFAEIAEVSFDGLERIGLQYYPDEKKIKGLPTEAGDHKVTMLFKIRGYEDRDPLEREVIFIINPDPRVLWSKNIPTPEDIEYYKPDSDKDFVKVE
jgi:hypothetical protein